MSGHHATLLRGTVEAFLPFYDVYITDWVDARQMPLAAGDFDLDDYIDYLIDICASLSKENDGVPLHTIGVCQPAVPLLAAVALMEAADSPDVPASMTLMGGPIDTRRSPTKVNLLAQERGSHWFRRNCISTVPFGYHGAGREVYPGFLQLAGFMAMNIDRHVNAHMDLFTHLVEGDGDLAEKAPRILRRISVRHGPHGRVLSADRGHGVRAARAAEGRDDPSRRDGRSSRHPPRRAADHRRRERRYLGRRARRSPRMIFAPTCRRI